MFDNLRPAHLRMKNFQQSVIFDRQNSAILTKTKSVESLVEMMANHQTKVEAVSYVRKEKDKQPILQYLSLNSVLIIFFLIISAFVV